MGSKKNIFNIISYTLISIIPIIIFLSTIMIKNAQGPYLQRNDYDPDYVYLINSLNLAQLKGYGVGNVEHPGTPVQVFGAIVLLLKYNLGAQDEDMVSSVLSNPNEYLKVINKTLIFLISIALFFLGVVVYKISGNIYLSLFIQMPFFISRMFIFYLTKVSAEPFLMFINLCLIIVIFLYLNKMDLDPKKQILFTIAFSVLIGLGVATKIIFIPVAIIPFMILPGIKTKLIYIASSVMLFFLFVMPAFSSTNISYFLKWVGGMITHGGIYGTGEAEVFNYNSAFQNLQKIITNAPVFVIVYILIFISVLAGLFLRKKSQQKEDIQFKLLIGIFIALTLQILMVVKHYGVYGERYLLPSFTFSLLGIYLCILIFFRLLKNNILKNNIKYVYPALIIIFLSLGIYHINFQIKSFSYLKKESNKFMDFINNNYPDAIKITSYGASSQEWGMYYATLNAGTQKSNYKSLLKDKYSNHLFWGLPTENCYTFEGSNNVNEIIFSNRKVIFLCNNDDYLNRFISTMKIVLGKPNLTLEKKFSNNTAFETVYEIKLE